MKKQNNLSYTLAAVISLVSLGCASAQEIPGLNGSEDLPKITKASVELPIKVNPNNPEIRYVGRFDTSDKAGPRCNWSASTAAFRFLGSAVNLKLDGHTSASYEIEVDGRPSAVLIPTDGPHLYTIFRSQTPGRHLIRLVRRTEAFNGIDQFLGLELSAGGRLLTAPEAAKRRIEIVGDSITCGYGNEGKSKEEHFTPATENAYLAYGAIAARSLGAEFVSISWSGKKMWPDNTMDELYDRTLATQSDPKWDFSRWIPDVVVINLCTNDWGKGAPDRAGWVAGYRKFIARVRTNYPKAAIYCAIGPMMWAEGLTAARSYLQEIVEAEQAAGDKNVRFIEFPVQKMEDGYGADWHPSVKTDQIMAAKLVSTLRSDLKWVSSAQKANHKLP